MSYQSNVRPRLTACSNTSSLRWRREQKLTQRHLAALADVSTPTLSRFERGEKDIQLSSVLKILGVLGMAVRRERQ